MGFEFYNGVFNVMFVVVFAFIVGVFLFIIISSIVRARKNSKSPRLTVEATVVSKRIDVSHSTHTHAGQLNGAAYHTTTSTTNYVTFQFESGDRMEFLIDGSEYGLLVEGDKGKLTFQGTRFIGFERI